MNIHIIEFESMRDLLVNSRGLLRIKIGNLYCYYMGNNEKGAVCLSIFLTPKKYEKRIDINQETGEVVIKPKFGMGVPIASVKRDSLVEAIIANYLKYRERENEIEDKESK